MLETTSDFTMTPFANYEWSISQICDAVAQIQTAFEGISGCSGSVAFRQHCQPVLLEDDVSSALSLGVNCLRCAGFSAGFAIGGTGAHRWSTGHVVCPRMQSNLSLQTVLARGMLTK
jgi:hypothetical protein